MKTVMKLLMELLLTAILLAVAIPRAISQAPAPCTSNMIGKIAPCFGYLTGIGNFPNGSCCDAFASLVSIGADCACSFMTGSIPFAVPINRTLRISLPLLCGYTSIHLKCGIDSNTTSPTSPDINFPGSTVLPPAPTVQPATKEMIPTRTISPSPATDSADFGVPRDPRVNVIPNSSGNLWNDPSILLSCLAGVFMYF